MLDRIEHQFANATEQDRLEIGIQRLRHSVIVKRKIEPMVPADLFPGPLDRRRQP
jgi:hypothetical protein